MEHQQQPSPPVILKRVQLSLQITEVKIDCGIPAGPGRRRSVLLVGGHFLPADLHTILERKQDPGGAKYRLRREGEGVSSEMPAQNTIGRRVRALLAALFGEAPPQPVPVPVRVESSPKRRKGR